MYGKTPAAPNEQLNQDIQLLCGEYARYNGFDEELCNKFGVKRGLRNADGSGVLVGLTTISNVHGYNKVGGTVVPDEGDLIIRGYRIDDLVAQTHGAGRFGYEEVAYLLVSGRLPNAAELADFNARIDSRRELPTGYLSLFPRTTESSSIMNVLARSTLLLYAFDEDPDSTAAQHEIDVALSLSRAAAAHRGHRARGVRLRGKRRQAPRATRAPGLLPWPRRCSTSCAAPRASRARRP